MWRQLTENDLVAALSRKEIDAYRRDFEIDPVPALLKQTAEMVRGYIRTNGSVRMDPSEASIPESCVGPAVDYAVISILKRINLEPTEVRRNARLDAVTYFRDVASGKNKPEDYDAPVNDETKMVAATPAFSEAKPERLLD